MLLVVEILGLYELDNIGKNGGLRYDSSEDRLFCFYTVRQLTGREQEIMFIHIIHRSAFNNFNIDSFGYAVVKLYCSSI